VGLRWFERKRPSPRSRGYREANANEVRPLLRFFLFWLIFVLEIHNSCSFPLVERRSHRRNVRNAVRRG